MSKPLNCWEFKECGREPGGVNAAAEACPAATEKSLDGIHRGDNAGRCCWTVAGTFCRGRIQGESAGKIDSCENCDFFRQVVADETENLQSNADLLLILGAVSR